MAYNKEGGGVEEKIKGAVSMSVCVCVCVEWGGGYQHDKGTH